MPNKASVHLQLPPDIREILTEEVERGEFPTMRKAATYAIRLAFRKGCAAGIDE